LFIIAPAQEVPDELQDYAEDYASHGTREPGEGSYPDIREDSD